MAIPRFTQGLSKTLLFTSLVTLVACGGGGGGGSKPAPTPSSATISLAASSTAITSVAAVSSGTYQSSATTSTQPASSTAVIASSLSNSTVSSVVASSYRAIDKSPDAVIFNAVNDAEVNQPYTSNTVTIKGVDEPVAISITGGRYSKNGGAYTSEASTITNGDTLKLEVISSAKKEDTKTATVTIGTLSASFSVKTELDREPPVATFSFPTPYTMATGETLNVRGTASDDIEIKSITLHLTDKKGEKAPEIVEAEHLDVDYQPDAPTFSNWKATVPLYDESETEIVVVAKDINGNEIKIDDGDKVVVKETEHYNVAFPEGKIGTGSYRRMVFDQDSETIFHGSSDRDERTVFKTKIQTAEVSKHFEYVPTLAGSYYSANRGAVRNGKIYFLVGSDDDTDGRLKAVDVIDTSENPGYSRSLMPDADLITHINTNNDSNILIVTRSQNSRYEWIIESYLLDENGDLNLATKKTLYQNRKKTFTDIKESVFVPEHGKVYFPDYYEKSIVSVDVNTGSFNTISSSTIGSGPNFNTNDYGLLDNLMGIETILYNRLTNKLVVSESLTGRVFEINTENGDRRVISTIGFPYINPGETKIKKTITSYALYLDEKRHVYYSAQEPLDALLVIDPITNGQVILAKDRNL